MGAGTGTETGMAVETAPILSDMYLNAMDLPERNLTMERQGSMEKGAGGKISDWNKMDCMAVAPASSKGTTSIELIGMAERAATIKLEVLEPWAESKGWHGLKTPLQPPQEGLR
jgi:hypothetical protein